MSEFAAVINQWPSDGLHGRRKIYTHKREITLDNVAQIASQTLHTHLKNRAEIEYLYDYYKGKQDIRSRIKTIRPEISNKVLVNHANEIVTFKTAYLLGEPIQYVSVGNEDDSSDGVKRLNEHMRFEMKDAKDKEIADWLHICGVGVRMVLPRERIEPGDAPFRIYTLDPRNAYCIYNSGLGEEKLGAVIRQCDENGNWYSCIYTDTHYFEIAGDVVITAKPHALGKVPVFEYVNNDSRMGSFESVIPLLNAINTVESNRVDDIEQIVQSILVFENCSIAPEQFKELRRDGGIVVKGEPQLPAKVYSIKNELGQTGTQTVVDDLYQKVLTICGMPNRNGGSSTSDTGTAVIYRDGFAEAESRAKDTEKSWLRSETDMLRMALRICRDTPDESQIEIDKLKVEFTRKNLSNIQSKAQVLVQLLNNSKVHPKYAYQASGLFADTEEAYRAGMEWSNQELAETEKTLAEAMADERRVSAFGQGNRTADEESGEAVRDGKDGSSAT